MPPLYHHGATEVPALYRVHTGYKAGNISIQYFVIMYEICATICAGGFLTMKKWLLALVTALVLAACGDIDTADNTSKTNEEIIEEGTVGFEVLGGSIEEASGVPVEEKEKILAAFNEYIEAFNAEDIDRYAQTTSKQAKGFDYELDLQEAQKVFDSYAINRQAEDVTIVKYNENEAQVFANLMIETTEEETNTELSSQGRQVTVFMKEDDAWKVSSVYYIGEN